MLFKKSNIWPECQWKSYLKKFMTDLVADQYDLYSWYQGINQSNEMTFLQFLIKENWLEDMLHEYELLADEKGYLQSAKESLKSGLIKGHSGDYSWKDITDGNGNPYYANKKRVGRKKTQEEMDSYEKSIREYEDAIHSYWEEYLKNSSTDKSVSFYKRTAGCFRMEKEVFRRITK